MKSRKVLIFAGTTEGRKLAEYLAAWQIEVYICVATKYGSSLLPKGEGIHVSHERLNDIQMSELLDEWKPEFVIDATHPYAGEVTENIREACGRSHVPCLRLVREPEDIRDCISVNSTKEAAEYLAQTDGNILVATGSKELECYTEIPDYKERVYARVLSTADVAAKCQNLGFAGRHLICMQGPFSVEMNVAMLKEFDITYMVTKESGATGGFQEKLQAAMAAGVRLVVIGRPVHEEGYTLEECLQYVKEAFQIADFWQVTVAGIGPGSPGTFTDEVRKVCQEAQLIVGAGRMIKTAAAPGQAVYQSYDAGDIITYIKKHPEYRKITVVVSGDVGFYSGAKNLLKALREEKNMEVHVLPGISSAVYFCAKLGLSWEDAAFVSFHGRQEQIIGVVRTHVKTVALAGSAEGIRSLCRDLVCYGLGGLRIFIGSNLSYDEERICSGIVQDFVDYEGDSLSIIYIENQGALDCIVTHGIPDDAFIRENVPMTKEEVRSVSLSKMHLTLNSIIYDVGAGTGSVAVESALQAVKGHVYAIEKNQEAAGLIRQNQKKFAADNLEVIEGYAPEALDVLPPPDIVFIGGSSGKLSEIVETVIEKNPSVRIVINAISVETLIEAWKCIEAFAPKEYECVQVQAARTRELGKYHMMMGQNPVYIISFEQCCLKEGKNNDSNT